LVFGGFLLLGLVSMETTTSSISFLRPFIRRREFLPNVNGGVRRSNFPSYGLSDLASPDQFLMVSDDCLEEVCPRRICPGCYILDNGDSFSRLSSDVDQAVRFVFFGIRVLVLLPMLYDYSNGCTRTCSLGIAAQIKIMGESSLVFAGLWFDIYATFLRLPSEKYKIMSWKKT
jgi:hypothetical protein